MPPRRAQMLSWSHGWQLKRMGLRNWVQNGVGPGSAESQPYQRVGDRFGGHPEVEVSCSADLLDGPASPPRLGRRLPIGVREEQVGARDAIPAGGARDPLFEEGELQRRLLPREHRAQRVVGDEVTHCLFAEPGRPGRQQSADSEFTQFIEEGRGKERRLARARWCAGVDEDQFGDRRGDSVSNGWQEQATAAVADEDGRLRQRLHGTADGIDAGQPVAWWRPGRPQQRGDDRLMSSSLQLARNPRPRAGPTSGLWTRTKTMARGAQLGSRILKRARSLYPETSEEIPDARSRWIT